MSDDSDGEWADDPGGPSTSSDDDIAPPRGQTDPPSVPAGPLLQEMGDIGARIAKLEAVECCSKHCFVAKRVSAIRLLTSLSKMSKNERQVSVLTALEMSTSFADRETKDRKRFPYYLPFVGLVCKIAFETAYGTSHRTLHIYRMRVRDGWISVKTHGNIENRNAAAIDEDLLVGWVESIAETVGEIVPVRVQRKPAGGAKHHHYFSYAMHTLLPPVFTWDMLCAEYTKSLDDLYEDTPRPSHSAFVRILHRRCPTITIRSGRSQVCDVCAIYHNKMGAEANAVETETFGDYLTTAKVMRVEYQLDISKSDKDNIVLIMDYAQNLTLPHVPDVPSSWYFLSLVSVSMFGFFCANDASYNHFMYTENKGGKGADEVTSMLHHALDRYGVFNAAYKNPVETSETGVRVTVWADNCGGQNKNSQVVWYLMFLVEFGVLNEVHLKCFTKGHTKNACDRGFGIIKRHMRRESCWTLSSLVDAIDRATANMSVTNLEKEENPFWSSKAFFAPRYKKLAGIQKYHIFRITREKPEFVQCKQPPTSTGEWMKIDKAKDPRAKSLADFATVWSTVPKAEDKPLNPEKVSDIYNKVLPYVPACFADDPIYQKPSEAMTETAREIKRARRSKADKKRKQREVEILNADAMQEEGGNQVEDEEGMEAIV